jgi:hypothetical protein
MVRREGKHSRIAKGANEMENGNLDKMAALLNSVGSEMILRAGNQTSDLWLYTEAGDAWADIALFKIGEGSLEWVDGFGELSDAIMALWDAAEPSKRWEAMEFEIHGAEFKTHFWFKGDLNPDDDSLDRRNALIRNKFNNYKVIYPPHPAS